MGMFDKIYVACPKCGVDAEFQSKAGKRDLKEYYLDTAPPEILLDIKDEERKCGNCKASFKINVAVACVAQAIVTKED